MINKKIIILAIFIVCLLTISVVSASENVTNNTLCIDETYCLNNADDQLISSNLSEEVKIENMNANINEDILSVENYNEISSTYDEDILSDSGDYYVGSFYGQNSINWGSANTIHTTLYPKDKDTPYSYNVYLEICDSAGSTKIWKEFSGSTVNLPQAAYNHVGLSYTVETNDLEPGVYTAYLRDKFGGSSLSSFNFNVNKIYTADSNPSSYSYCSVNVQTPSSSNNKINLQVSSRLGYNFYLKVYDSKNSEVISKNYYNDNGGSYSLTYDLSSKNLDIGDYSIKIINAKDGTVISGDIFSLKSNTAQPYAPNYNVNVGTSARYSEIGGLISMTISSVNTGPYKSYRYSFYLKVYDAEGVEKISKFYSGESSGTVYKNYTINPAELPTGKYTIKILDEWSLGWYPIKESKFTILSLSYAVNVKDYKINYGYTERITLYVSPIHKTSSNYSYNFDLEIVGKNGVISSKNYQGNAEDKFSINYYIDYELLPGDYTVHIIDNHTKDIICSSNLKVKSIGYSVNVPDTSMAYDTGGNIDITIDYNVYSTNYSNYNYNFYLLVRDSDNGHRVIYKSFSGQEDHVYNHKTRTVSYSIGARDLDPGIYNVSVIDLNGEGYVGTTAKLTVNSLSHNAYSVKVKDTNITYGNSGDIVMSVYPSSNTEYKYDFYIKVYDSNGIQKISKRYYSTVSTKSLTHTISKTLDPGIYTIKILNSGDRYVMGTARLRVMSVSYNDYSVEVKNTNITYGNDGNITMSISPASNGTYKYDFNFNVYDSNDVLKISKRYYNVNSINSLIHTINNELNPGVYTIKILNSEDDYLMDTAKLIVNKIKTNIIAPNITTTYNDNDYLVITLNNQEGDVIKGAKLFININGVQSAITNDKGQVKISTKGLIPHLYNVFISFEGNDTYDKSNVSSKVRVLKANTQIVMNDLSGVIGDKFTLTVNIVSNDLNINEGLITFYDDGINIGESYISGSIASLTYAPSIMGTHIITTRYYNSNNYLNSSSSSRLNVKSFTNILAPSMTTVYNQGKYFVVILKDNNNNVISGADLSIKLSNGNSRILITDKNGQVKYLIKGLTPKTYTATITFAGNTNYVQSSNTAKVIVKKATPKITAKAKTFKKSVKTKKYTITLKNNLNKVMKNTKVTIKVNKKTYTAKTNSKGVATFKITKLTKKGTFKSVITYKGSNYYNKVTKTVNIKCK